MDLTKAHDLTSLARVLGCSARQLGYYVYRIPLASQYKYFEIPKRRGGVRPINAPATNLKIIQKSIARELEKLVRFKPCVTGFVNGRDIRKNASLHVSQRHVLNIDLEDFFGTVNYGRVYGLLAKRPFNFATNVSAAIAKACTLNNALPQGAPSSPILSNLICAKMDAELNRFALANKCVYSRYADDLTFSTNKQQMPLAFLQQNSDGTTTTQIVDPLRAIIESNGFRINEKKVRLSSRMARQQVTGLVVNKRVNVRRSFIREIRAMLHAWRKFGKVNAEKVFHESFGGSGISFEDSLRGKIGFVGQIRGRPDDLFRSLALQFNALATAGKIRTILSHREIAEQAVWVIEHDDADQGTAFFIEKIGIVTCAHCVGPNPIIYHPSNHAETFKLTLRAKDEHRDLAIFEVPIELKNVVPLPAFEDALANNSDIVLLGYPNHFKSHPVRVEAGKLLRTFSRSAVSYYEISPKIISGNSGGPVLNEHNQVVGIAVRGVNGTTSLNTAEFLAVKSSELLALLK